MSALTITLRNFARSAFPDAEREAISPAWIGLRPLQPSSVAAGHDSRAGGDRLGVG